MADIGFFIGAIIATGLLSRLMLWGLRSWKGGTLRLAVANGVALLIAVLLGGMGMADGGPFAPLKAAMYYAPAQVIWLVIDFLRQWREPSSPPPTG